MAGGTLEHARLCANTRAALARLIAGRRCVVYGSDARVRVLASGLITYPDVTVACGSLERNSEDRNALTNPLLVVEVTSPKTESHDRGAKLAHYRQIASLREVVIVSHRERAVDVWRRLRDGSWARDAERTEDVVRLESLDATVAVEEIYRDPMAE